MTTTANNHSFTRDALSYLAVVARCGSTAPGWGSPPFPRPGVFLPTSSGTRAASSSARALPGDVLGVSPYLGPSPLLTTCWRVGCPRSACRSRRPQMDTGSGPPERPRQHIDITPSGNGRQVAGGTDAPARRIRSWVAVAVAQSDRAPEASGGRGFDSRPPRIADRSGDALSRNNPARAGVVPARGWGLGVAA